MLSCSTSINPKILNFYEIISKTESKENVINLLTAYVSIKNRLKFFLCSLNVKNFALELLQNRMVLQAKQNFLNCYFFMTIFANNITSP